MREVLLCHVLQITRCPKLVQCKLANRLEHADARGRSAAGALQEALAAQ